MRRLAIAGAGVVLALSAACGAQTQAGSSAPKPELPSPSETTEPVLPPEGAPAGAKLVTKVDTSKLPEGYPRKAWTEGEGSRVGITAQEGGCSKASVEIAEQAPTQVVLNVIESNPKTEQMCTMDIRYPVFTVNLNAPLADRTLVLMYQQRTY
jgi:hypothetical protein